MTLIDLHDNNRLQTSAFRGGGGGGEGHSAEVLSSGILHCIVATPMG